MMPASQRHWSGPCLRPWRGGGEGGSAAGARGQTQQTHLQSEACASRPLVENLQLHCLACTKLRLPLGGWCGPAPHARAAQRQGAVEQPRLPHAAPRCPRQYGVRRAGRAAAMCAPDVRDAALGAGHDGLHKDGAAHGRRLAAPDLVAAVSGWGGLFVYGAGGRGLGGRRSSHVVACCSGDGRCAGSVSGEPRKVQHMGRTGNSLLATGAPPLLHTQARLCHACWSAPRQWSARACRVGPQAALRCHERLGACTCATHPLSPGAWTLLWQSRPRRGSFSSAAPRPAGSLCQ